MPENVLYCGDNLEILRNHVDDQTVDLVYLDPPFNSNQDYRSNSASTAVTGSTSSPMFQDTWRWNDAAEKAFNELQRVGSDQLSTTMEAFHRMPGEGSMLSYLTTIALRLFELHRVLKTTGSIYLHCDQHASGHLRLLMDSIFQPENFLNCIVWCYGLGGSSSRYWPRKHDDILWYSREQNKHYFKAATIPATSLRMKGKDKKAPDYWHIPTINNMARERTGYPTQKPEKLLERIIVSSSREGDLVLDPYCGSGTTVCVAQKLGRRWIGIDNNEAAVRLSRERLSKLPQLL